MTKKQVYNTLILFLFGCFVGSVIRYWHQLTFDFQIRVFDVFALIVTVFLAWWVTEKLEKDSAVERCEKDILIEKLKVMEGIIESIEQKSTQTELVQLSDVNALIGKFDILSNRVAMSIENRYPSIINKDVDYREEFEFLDNMCTNDQTEGFEPGSIVMDEHDGISTCIYSQERRDTIDETASGILDKIFNLQLLLNRA